MAVTAQLADGTQLNFPDGTAPEVVQSTVKRVLFAQKLQADRAQMAKDYAPTVGMNPLERFVAGYGKAGSDLVKGVGQLIGDALPGDTGAKLGLPTRESVDETKRLDAPLLDTRAGMVGNIAGNVVDTLPAMAIPGANTVRGAALVGSAIGGLGPVGTGDSRLTNMALGGAGGAGGVVVGRALKAGYQGAKALVAPFTQAGRDEIAGRTLARFADNPASLNNVSSTPTITGAVPTLAEQTGDRGLAQLQDALRTADPQIENMIGQRLADNNAARVSQLKALAGQDGARALAADSRDATAEQLYGQARKAGIDPSKITPEALQNIAEFAQRVPDSILNKAKYLAKVNGTPIDDATSIQGLHWVKKAIDGAIGVAQRAGDGEETRALVGLQKDLLAGMDNLSNDYKAARLTYQQMSQPVNQYDIAQKIADKALSNGSDLAGNQTINRNALLGIMKNEPGLIKQATGMNGNTLADVMTPEQMTMLNAIKSEVDRAGAVASAGAGPGSATAKRLASQNVLQQIVGPTGLPKSWGESAFANTIIGKPLNLLYGGIAEPKIQQALAEAVLDPAKAKSVLAAAQKANIQLPPTIKRQLVEAAAKTATPALLTSKDR